MTTPTFDTHDTTASPASLDETLDLDLWTSAGRELLAKVIREFTYEELVDPDRTDDGYRLQFETATYRFDADERLCDSLLVDAHSIGRDAGDGFQPATDPVQFLRDAADAIGVDDLTAGHLVREYEHTRLADAHVLARERERGPEDVTELSYADIEGEMTGHPWITYNKGRIGWGYDDYREYAPEMQRNTHLEWLAVSCDRANVQTVEDIDHESVVRNLLEDQYEAFSSDLRARGLDPDMYVFLPVHEWQWDNAIAGLYGGLIASDDLVNLGTGRDRYRPMQSVRTFLNVSDASKPNVKLPMRILNTLVWRGLPGERTEAAPLVTEYVKDIRDSDPFLSDECDLVLPGEVASVNVNHPDFAEMTGAPYQYDELLGVVYRESVQSLLDESERPVTLSALMHVSDSEPFVTQLVEESGLSLEVWLDELFSTLLPPLLHYLYRYGTVFSPHGENTILVLENGVPTRLAIKDFVDDVNVTDRPLPELEALPADLREVLRSETPEGLCQFIFCGLFVCVLRYISNVLTEYHDYPEEQFWRQVRDAVLDYQAQFPDLEERFELFDLLRPTFTKLCLNRNRLLEEGYGDDGGRPHAAEHGAVTNPLWEVARDN